MSSVFYPYFLWEDWKSGMFSTPLPSQVEQMVADALSLLSDCDRLRAAMEAATKEWKVAASHNLRGGECNHRSWLGQAACCIDSGVCEEATRKAWCKLTPLQQSAANAVADRVYEQYKRAFKVQMEFEFNYA
jgi:hypothetical protein